MRWPEMFFRPKPVDQRDAGPINRDAGPTKLDAEPSKRDAKPDNSASLESSPAASQSQPSPLKVPEITQVEPLRLPPIPPPVEPLPVLSPLDDPIPPPSAPLLPDPAPGSYAEIPAAIELARPAIPIKPNQDYVVGESHRRMAKLTDVAKLVSAKRSKPAKARPAPTRVVLKRRGMAEFFLINGERVSGEVVSQNDKEVVVLNHTIGRVTLLRSELAKDVRELVLINGDRLVGEVIAESPDQVYLRHSSLGTLIIQRSRIGSHVAEAQLPDGSLIVGEVLGERDGFTIIRSMMIGTVSVQNDKVSFFS